MITAIFYLDKDPGRAEVTFCVPDRTPTRRCFESEPDHSLEYIESWWAHRLGVSGYEIRVTPLGRYRWYLDLQGYEFETGPLELGVECHGQ